MSPPVRARSAFFLDSSADISFCRAQRRALSLRMAFESRAKGVCYYFPEAAS